MEKNIDILNINRSGFESIVLIYGIDSNPEGWINEDSLINLASGGNAAKRMISEVLDKLSEECLVERRKVGGRGFFRRTTLGISTARQLKDVDDISLSKTFAVGDDGMIWKPERGNPKNFEELIGQSSAKNLILKKVIKIVFLLNKNQDHNLKHHGWELLEDLMLILNWGKNMIKVKCQLEMQIYH